MKRTRSYLRFTFPLALFLGTTALATTTPLTPAAAEWVVQYDGEDPDGSHYTLYKETGVGDLEHFKVVTQWPNGNWQEVTYWLNSNPDDPTGGKGTEKPDVAGMLKKAKGLTVHISASPKEGTPLAGWLESEGRGGSIRWNPSDDSDKGGPGQPPTGHTGGLTPKQLASLLKQVNFSAKSLAAIGTSMGDGVDGLAGESAPTPNKTGGRGTGTSDGKGDGDNKNKWRGGGEVVTLGPRPDLVNPAPKNKTGSSKLVAPKLLHTNKGFSHSGPTATGKWFRGGAPGGNLR